MRRLFQHAGQSTAVVILLCLCPASTHAISSVVNISTRMVVETGDNVLIGGFIGYCTVQKTLAVRSIGPSLPVVGALRDPRRALRGFTGALCSARGNVLI